MVETYADQYIEVDNIKELIQIYNQGFFDNNFFILGGGSNTLFVNDYKGSVIHPNILGKKVLNEKKEAMITIGAGESWEDFVKWSVDQNFLGLQNLANIPGSCGAAPVQNIGAYGVEVKDFITSVEYFDIKTGEVKHILNKDCKLGYRDSIFKHELKDIAIITSITFKLKKWEKDLEVPENFLTYKGIVDKLTTE